MGNTKKIKIKMFDKHLCNISKKFLRSFDIECRVINFSAWIREQAYIDFKINLLNAEDLLDFNEILEENNYENVADWLREKMRARIKEVEKH